MMRALGARRTAPTLGLAGILGAFAAVTAFAALPVKKELPRRPEPAAEREVVKSAQSLPTLSQIAARRTPPVGAAVSDTFLMRSSSFDVLSGGCDPRGWLAEDLAERVFAHVADRHSVNRDIFSWRVAPAPLVYPSVIASTLLPTPQYVASNDSGMVFFVEHLNDGARIVAVYPDQNVMRKYADLPTFPGVTSKPFHIAYDQATGGLIVGSDAGNNTRGGRLYRIPAGGGAPVQLAGGGFTSLDAPVSDAVLECPREIVTDAAGNIYFIEERIGFSASPRVRRLRASDSYVETLAGMLFFYDDAGDGGPGTSASLSEPGGLALNASEDTLYILDRSTDRVRALSLTTGIIDALPGAQSADFDATGLEDSDPTTLAFADGRLYVGCEDGVVFTWRGGELTHVSGARTPFTDPANASLGTAHAFGGGIRDLGPAPGDGILMTVGSHALLYRLSASGQLSVIAGVSSPMQMGLKSLWVGADSLSAPDEVAHWRTPGGYGNGWSQRITSPLFSLADHPNARLTFDARVELGTSFFGDLEFASDDFFVIQGLRADGRWTSLVSRVITNGTPETEPFIDYQLAGRAVIHIECELTDSTLADMTRVRILVQSDRERSNQDYPYGASTGAGGLVIDNLRVVDTGDVLAPVDFEDGTTGAWTLSALNAPYGFVGKGSAFFRDFNPPGTQVELHTGFDFSDPSCVWTFTSAGDSVTNGTYARLTSPWIALADRNAPTYITFSGKLPTDNQMRYLKAYVRGKNAGDVRPALIEDSQSIYSSGTTGGDLASPFLNQVVLVYPDDFSDGEVTADFADSLQIVFQIEDRYEENREYTPGERVPSRLPYLDDFRIYQRSGDTDHDGVANAHDACPAVSAAGQDADGNGCPDPTATLRHVETWNNASRPIHYRISANGDAAITDGSDLQAVRDAIAKWTSVPGASVPLIEDPVTSETNSGAMDGINLVTWGDELEFSPDILAITPTTSFTQRAAFDDQIVLPGQIIDSDLIFNTAATYRTATTGPIPNSVDLESVATHEIGHLLGLSHSGVAEATMFPVLQDGTAAASLEADDRAAIGAAYPGPSYTTAFGTITGTVQRGSNSQPIPGALVTAWSLNESGEPIAALASDYSAENGTFALRGLAAGDYGVKVEPLDGSVPALIPAAISVRVLAIAQTNFTGEWWSASDDGIDPTTLITPIPVTAGVVASGHTVVTSIDVIPPEVVSAFPADAADSVGISGRILVNFSEPVEVSTLSAGFALRRTGDSGRLGGQAQILNSNRTFIFTPDDALMFEAEYEIEVTTELTDRQGVPLAATYLAHFSTIPTPNVAIFDIQPRQAAPGALITVRGAGFSGFVEFEYQTATGPEIAFGSGIASGDAFVTLTSSNIVSGPVRVIADGDTSNAFNFTVLSISPAVPTQTGTPVSLAFAPTDVALSPEGRNAFAVGEPGFARIALNPASHNPFDDFLALPGSRRIAMANDGRRAFVTRPDSIDLVEVDTDTTSAGFGQVFTRILLPGSPGGVFMSPDGAKAYVSEDQGAHVWLVDTDPASATYRGILKEYELAGVTLTGGMGVAVETQSAIAHRRGASAPRASAPPQRPRTHAEPYDELFLTSSSHGVLSLNLSDGSFLPHSDRPCSDNLAMTADGHFAIAIGSGSAEGVLPRGCLGSCVGIPDPAASLGGRPRDLVMNPRASGLFVVNAIAGQLQVLERSGASYVPQGQVGTGRNPVALATDVSGTVIVVANAGDRTVGVYGVTSSASLASVYPGAAFPGAQVAVRLASGPSAAYVADLGGGTIPPTFTRGGGLTFAVPALPQQTVAVSLDGLGGRTFSLPLDIVDPITTLAPLRSGEFLANNPEECKASVSATSRALAVSGDGRVMAVLTQRPGCGIEGSLIQLRADAPEPLYSVFPGGVWGYADAGIPRGGVLSLDGKRFWAVMGPNGLFDHDVDPASPFFGTGFVAGFLPGETFAIAADPMMPHMFVSARITDGGTRSVVDVYHETHDALTTIDLGIPDTLASLAVSPDGHALVMGGEGRAYFVDLGSGNSAFPGSPSPTHAGTGLVTSIGVTADGRRAVGVFRSGEVAVWSLEFGSEGQELYFGDLVPGAGLGTVIAGLDPHSVLAGATNGNLYRIDVAGPAPVADAAPLSAPAPLIARTPDARRVFAAGDAQGLARDTIRVYAMSQANGLSLVTGGDQEAATDVLLPLPIEVRLTDALGHAQAGAQIEFSLSDASQGALAGALQQSVFTDIEGNAQVQWTMPPTPGPVSLAVRASGLPIAPLAITAVASEDPTTAVPVVTAFGPPSGRTGISANSEVFVRFSQAMDSTNTIPFLSLRLGTDAIPGSFRMEDGGRAVFFKAAEPLPYLAPAVLRVDAGALDREGQALAAAESTAFTVQDEPGLSIEMVSPPAGSPGSPVTLNGQGYSPVPALNIVTFGGVLAPVISASPTTLVARVPETAVSGEITVQVASVVSDGVPFVVLAKDPRPGSVLDTLPTRPDPLRLVITPDGRRAYVVSPKTNAVGALDIFTARELAVIPVGSNPRGIAMLPDGSRTYVANRDGANVSVFGTDPDSLESYHRVIGTIKVGPKPVAIAVISVGPKLVVVCQGDSSAKIIDAQRGNATFEQVVKNVPLPSSGNSVAISPDGSRIFIGTGSGVSILDLQSFVVKNVPLPSSGNSVALSPDGGLLFVVTGDRHLVVIDVSPTSSTPNRVVKNTPLPSSGSGVALSPDGALLFVTLADDGSVLIFTIDRGSSRGDGSTTSPTPGVSLELAGTHPVGIAPAGMAVDPFGEFVLVANQGSDNLTMLLSQPAPPQVQVTYPNGGEILLAGTNATLTWSTDRFPNGEVVDLAISRDNGQMWETIGDNLPNTGSFEWTVFRPTIAAKPTARFRVTARNAYGDTGSDQSDGTFTIFDDVTPTLLVNFAATPRPGGVELRWQLAPTTDVRVTGVERANDQAGPWAPIAAAAHADGNALVALDAAVKQGHSYWYRLVGQLGDGSATRLGLVTASMPVLEFALEPVAPNPSSGPVAISFAVARETRVKVSILDVAGRRVATLVDGDRPAGLHRVVWNGDARGRVSAGLYFLRYEAAGKAFTRRFVLAR